MFGRIALCAKLDYTAAIHSCCFVYSVFVLYVSYSNDAVDQYGFYTKLDRGDDEALAAVADKLNRQV